MTKYVAISIFFLFVSFNLFAQVNGNGKINTVSQSIQDFDELEISFPAKVTIACGETPGLSITTDENIFKQLDIYEGESRLTIDPKKWIEPTQIAIEITVPTFKKLKTGGYGNYKITGLNAPAFQLQNIVATVKIEGRVEEFNLMSETGKTDASQLVAQNVQVGLWSHGKAIVNPVESLHANVTGDGEVIYVNRPQKFKTKEKQGGSVISLAEQKEEILSKPRYFNVALKNNSGKKVDLIVRGPKSHRFSYGLPLRAGQKRKERFPVGTEIFLDKVLGKKLLATVKETDENGTIKLFN